MASKKKVAKKKVTGRSTSRKPVALNTIPFELMEEVDQVNNRKKNILLVGKDGTTLRVEVGIKGDTSIIARRALAKKVIAALAV